MGSLYNGVLLYSDRYTSVVGGGIAVIEGSPFYLGILLVAALCRYSSGITLYHRYIESQEAILLLLYKQYLQMLQYIAVAVLLAVPV